MSAFRPPSGKSSGGQVRTLETSPRGNTRGEEGTSPFSGRARRARRASEGDAGRRTPTTGVRPVNAIMQVFNREIAQMPAGMHPLIMANTQSELENTREYIIKKLETERKKLNNMETKPKTVYKNMNKQEKIIKTLENKLREYDNAIERVFGQKNGPPKIIAKQRNNVPRPTPKTRTKSVNFLDQLKLVTGKINRSRQTVVESQAPTRQTNFPSKQRTSTDAPNPSASTGQGTTSRGTQTEPPKKPNPPVQSTPKQPIKKPTKPQSIKNQGARKRREREGSPAVRRALNQIANQKNTPPGITKTNLERLFQPFKQPVTVTVAPTISVKGGSAKATGGSAKQGIVMLASNATKKKKKTPPPKPQYLKTPGTIRREKEKARSISVRKQLVASMRTPTKGQRKTHVIQLIDRVLRKMKAPKDTEKKLIKLYESLSEKQIKSLFGGRSPEFVKNTLKKQIGYLEKKKR